MVANVFKAIFITSCMGTLLSLILFLIKPVTKKVFSAGWNYYVWLIVLVVMILPVKIPIQQNGAEQIHIVNEKSAYTVNTDTSKSEYNEIVEVPDIADNVTYADVEEIKPSAYETIKDFLIEKTDVIAYIWLIGVVVMLVLKISGYVMFLIKVRKNSEVIHCSEITQYTKRKVVTRVCGFISSPLMTGIIKPTLLLPEAQLTDEQMYNVFSHEMTHLKRNDILYKWFLNIVKCIHWFNPVIYLVGNTINKECEISCDIAVVDNMSKEEVVAYVDTIIALITSKTARINSLTTEMTGEKKTLKERFEMIKSRRKISKKTVVISISVAVLVLVGAVFVSGVIGGMYFKDTAMEEAVKLTNNGKLISFKNKPFMEKEMAYFPLEELVVKLNTENKVENNGEKYVIYVKDAMENYTVSADIKEIYYSGQGGARRQTEYAPILKENIIYIPYEYVRYIFADANDYDIGGSFLYKNYKMNIKFEIPLGWCGKYILDESAENENVIVFKHKATAEKYEFAGTLFSVYRIEDANVDEAMRVYGNMTVVWRNAEFAYVVARPTDVQYPIWVDRDKEDIDIAIEYESLYAGINYIQETFKLIDESKEKSIPVIENAEELSYAQMKDLQRMVDEGHFPWRLDYEQVIMMWVSAQGEDVVGGRIVAFSGGGQDCSATYIVNGNTYIVELFKPIRNDDSGIWIVRSCEKQIPSIAHGIYFYKRTPGQEWILPRDDGWYNMIQHTMAVFPGEALGVGALPKSIVAYFTDAGTDMEQYQRKVGRADGPFAQIPITLEIDFSENDTLGHLHFVYYYEDGTTKTSQYYNVLVQ